MIKSRRYKARGDMAHIAIITGWHMVRRRGFAFCSGAIVARCTVINDAQVIKPGTSEGCGDVAHGAILCRRQVVQ